MFHSTLSEWQCDIKTSDIKEKRKDKKITTMTVWEKVRAEMTAHSLWSSAGEFSLLLGNKRPGIYC